MCRVAKPRWRPVALIRGLARDSVQLVGCVLPWWPGRYVTRPTTCVLISERYELPAVACLWRCSIGTVNAIKTLPSAGQRRVAWSESTHICTILARTHEGGGWCVNGRTLLYLLGRFFERFRQNLLPSSHRVARDLRASSVGCVCCRPRSRRGEQQCVTI